MKWILIYMIFISSGGIVGKGGATIEMESQEFSSKEACEKAGSVIKSMKFQRRGRDWLTIKANCFKK